MPTTILNPLADLTDGIVKGYTLAHQIKQQAMAEEAHQRNMAAMDRENQVRDIQTRMMLDQNARPVNAGTVTQPGNSAPLNVAGIDLGQMKAPDLVRPVDKSRKVSYGGQDYELFTPEEQLSRAMDRYRNEALGKGRADIEVGRTLRGDELSAEGGGVQLPSWVTDTAGFDPGPVTRREALDYTTKATGLRKENRVVTEPGKDVVDLTPGGKPQVLVSGGAPLAHDDFGQYLDAVAKNNGLKSRLELDPKAVLQAREDFQGSGVQATEANLALKAAKGDRLAEAALKRLDQSKREARPVNQFVVPQNAPAGAATIDQVPENIRGTVAAITQYRQALPPLSRNNPTNQAIQYWVNKVSPEYRADMFPARNKMLQGYTSGSQSKEIGGINTALGHVAVLGDAIDALHSGNVQLLNEIANKWRVATGKDPVTTYKAIVHKVAPELNRAYVGGVGAQGEILAQESDFDPKLSPQQKKANVAMTAKLLRSKIGSLENQWKQTMGSDDFGRRFIMPEAQAAVDKWAPEGSATQAGAPANPYR